MKIYFAGSIRGGRDDKELYAQIIKLLSKYGEVLTEHIGNANLSSLGETELSNEDIYNRDISWIRNADIVVAEVTTPSLGVGYEIAKSENMDKNVLCIYHPTESKLLSAIIDGNLNITKKQYQTIEDLKKYLMNFLKSKF